MVKGMNYLMKEQEEERREHLVGAGQETLSFKFPSREEKGPLEILSKGERGIKKPPGFEFHGLAR